MAASSIIEQLKNSNSTSRINILTEYIRTSLAEFLEFDDKNEIAVDQNFVELGVSSMESVNFKIQLENELECALKTTLFFDYPTLDILVTYLLKEVLKLETESDHIETDTTHKKEDSTTTVKNDPEQMVIIAMDAMFPNAMTPNQLWEQSINNSTTSTNNKTLIFNKLPSIPYTNELSDFGITKELFSTMTKQQKLAYTSIHNALNTYAISEKELTSSKTGVFFVANGLSENSSIKTPYQVPLSNDISFRLNFNGPSEIINTFCSSIYVAMHRAIQSIQAHECEQAIIGGVNTISKKTFTEHANQGIYNDLLSANNTMYSFSEQANGFTRSEGAGSLLITTLSKALKNNHPILAIVKATTIAHGGKNFSIEAPKASEIKNTISTCIQKSNISADTIDYIEAHGIANPLADAIELSSLHNSYSLLSNQQNKKWHISTVKPVTGHPELVSGIASLVKVIKAFEHEILPGIKNLQSLNTEIPIDHNLSIQKENIPWSKTSYPKRAALNSYAIGGVNAHVILEKYTNLTSNNKEESLTKNSQNTEQTTVSLTNDVQNIINQTIVDVFNLPSEKIDYSLSPMHYGFDSIKIIQFIRLINEKLTIDIKIGEALGINSFSDFFELVSSKKKLNTNIKPITVKLSHDFSHETTLFQKGLWLVQELDPLSSAYNLPIVFQLNKEIQSSIVLKTVAYLVEKHPVLRVYFKNEKEQLIQKLHSIANCLHIDEGVFNSTAKEEFLKLTRIPFNLEQDCLFRVYKRVDLHKNEHYLAFIIHHNILDGLSGTLFMKLFWETYHNFEKEEKVILEEINTHFFDFVSWENSYLKNEQATTDLLWWKKQLSESVPLLLPYNHVKNIAIPHQTKEVVSAQITGKELQQLKEAARSMNLSLSVLLMAGFQILLHKLTQQEDITIATPIEGRQKTAYQNSLGTFVNVILMRSKLNKQKTILENISTIQNGFLTSLNHSNYPLTSLLAELAKDSEEPNNLNVGVSYTYQNIFDSIMDNDIIGANAIPIYDIYQETQDEYALEVYDFRDALQINFKYKKLLFEKQTIEKHLKYFLRIINQVTTNNKIPLSDLNILPQEEVTNLLTHFNKTHIGFPKDKTIVDLFEAQVVATPNNTAVTYLNEHISYQKLNAKANQLARYLIKKRVTQKDLVVLSLDKSIDLMISILAVLKTGATYVPVDPDYPIHRIQYSINDAKPKSIICTAELFTVLEEIYPQSVLIKNVRNSDISTEISENLSIKIHPEDPMYVIYTSGTTGNPKGVVVTHKNVVRLLKPEQALFNFNEKDVWTLFHSYCFDFSVWEMYGALLFGGRLVIVSDEVRKDTALFYELLVREKVSILNQTPSAFYALQNQLGNTPEKTTIRYVIFGGEALQPSLIEQWHSTYPNCKLINMYGITETTVHVTYQEITRKEINEGNSTIGTPIPTLSCYVLDANLNLLPNGVAGELYVGGHGVAKGYLNNPTLTKERFIKNPFQQNTLLYKTGDVVKYNYKNELEYIGRIDEQVKIRGHRIELTEIENVLLTNTHILQSVVVATEISANNKQLTAYIKLKEVISKNQILEFLESKLPKFMIPSVLFIVDDFSLTTNGKVDKKKLPLPNFKEIQKKYVAPTNDIEKSIITIFEEILVFKKISIIDNFFELGGHSLLVMKTIHNINSQLNTKLAAKHLFKFPTAKQLALCIQNGDTKEELVNLQNELKLAPILKLPPTEFVFPTEPKHIFVTGGTGFVGAFLLYELLENTNAQLHCLTRANSAEEAFAKIKKVMTTYNLWQNEYTPRIKSIIGDIGAPLLGLNTEQFDHFSTQIDVIYHNAAHMNHIATYQDLKTANVIGTTEIIKLASTHKIKPIHYTSTLAVFNNTIREEVELITEQSTSENEIHYESDGYQTSKWVGENIILKAQKEGLPCNIYRLGLTTGDSVQGMLDNKQWFYSFIKSCITMETMINEDLNIKLPMMPVDLVAKYLVSLSLKKSTLNQTFHLVGKPISLHTIFKTYNEFNIGAALKETSMFEWLKLIKNKPELSVPPFMLEYLELEENELTKRRNTELIAKLEFKTSHTEKQIGSTQKLFTSIDSKVVLNYFSYVKESLKLDTEMVSYEI